MYIAKAQISPVLVVLCMGLISNAYAAASVRVLGSGSNGSAIKATTSARATTPKSTVLGAGNTTKKATTMKLSTSGASGQSAIRPVAKTTTASVGSSSTTTTERFPSVANLGNLPTGYKSATTTSGYSMTSVNSKLSDLQDGVDALTSRVETLEGKVDDLDFWREGLVSDISTLETVQNNLTELQETVQNIQNNNNNNFYIEGGEDAPEEEVANIFDIEGFEEQFGG